MCARSRVCVGGAYFLHIRALACMCEPACERACVRSRSSSPFFHHQVCARLLRSNGSKRIQVLPMPAACGGACHCVCCGKWEGVRGTGLRTAAGDSPGRARLVCRAAAEAGVRPAAAASRRGSVSLSRKSLPRHLVVCACSRADANRVDGAVDVRTAVQADARHV